MGKWKDVRSYGSETFVTHKVGEQDVKFWPVSVSLLLKLRPLLEPLSQSISVLTANNNTDTSQTYREIGDAALDHEGKTLFDSAGRPIRNTESISEAIDPKLAQMREQQRTKAVKELIEAATDDNNLAQVGAILIDSVRRGDFFDEVPTAKEFVSELSPEVLMQFVIGVGKANKGVFGPLAGRFEGMQDALKRRVNLEPKKNPTRPGSGETSEIRLSGSPSEDSTSDG